MPCSDIWSAVKDVLSGFEHNDSSDFRKRVVGSFAKVNEAKPAEPEAPGK